MTLNFFKRLISGVMLHWTVWGEKVNFLFRNIFLKETEHINKLLLLNGKESLSILYGKG